MAATSEPYHIAFTTGFGNCSRQSSARFRPVTMPSLADMAWNSMATTFATTTTHNNSYPQDDPAWILVAKLPGSM